MRISDAFPTKYLKAGDLQGRRHTLTVSRVVQEEGIDKPIIYFQGAQKGMAVNKTNAMMISQFLGDETDGWIGRQIELYTAQVLFEGKFVPAIRVSQPMQPMPAHENGPLPASPAPEQIPARTVHPAPDPNAPLPPAATQPQGGGAYVASAADDLTDEIPFGPCIY